MIQLPKPDHPVRVWGIDLGTTNSTLSEVVWEPGQLEPECRCLELSQETETGPYTGPLVPSVVAKMEKSVWVGQGAKRLMARPDRFRNEVNLFYGTKNEMGVRKTYSRAPDDYNQPWKIGGHILRFLREQASQECGHRPHRTVVTVPASFQINQRLDTLKAAELAGIKLNDFDLLDEPTAALLDYLLSPQGDQLSIRADKTHILVFDFGGGTCDISIVRLGTRSGSDLPTATMLAVSRYHRIGGGDIDTAIVHQGLIPALLRQHGIEDLELSWTDKKKTLEPELLAAAESLKIGLCREIRRLRGLNRWSDSVKDTTVSKQPSVRCKLGGRELDLAQPDLTAKDFEAILSQFLDRDVLFTRETDYTLSTSIFAPLSDSLERADLSATDIDAVLLVGGSSLIPQVQDAVRSYFGNATLCQFEEAMEAQLAVSRGAAWHAYFLEVLGRPFIEPVVPETIALLAEGGRSFELVPAGATLPFPSGGGFRKQVDALTIPCSGLHELVMEVVAIPSNQRLFTERWKLPDGTDEGDPINAEVRMTANSQLEIRASLSLDPEAVFEKTADNPLVNVVNPGETRMRIQELEEELREKKTLVPDDVMQLRTLSKLYAKLSQYERAIEYLRTALRVLIRPDADLLNLQGVYYSDLGDIERASKCYGAAVEADPKESGPWFNLSLACEKQNRLNDALDCLEKALAIDPNNGAYLTFKAMLLKRLGKDDDARRLLGQASEAYPPIPAMSLFELHWHKAWARMTGATQKIQEVDEEFRKRRKGKVNEGEVEGMRPKVAQRNGDAE